MIEEFCLRYQAPRFPLHPLRLALGGSSIELGTTEVEATAFDNGDFPYYAPQIVLFPLYGVFSVSARGTWQGNLPFERIVIDQCTGRLCFRDSDVDARRSSSAADLRALAAGLGSPGLRGQWDATPFTQDDVVTPPLPIPPAQHPTKFDERRRRNRVAEEQRRARNPAFSRTAPGVVFGWSMPGLSLILGLGPYEPREPIDLRHLTLIYEPTDLRRFRRLRMFLGKERLVVNGGGDASALFSVNRSHLVGDGEMVNIYLKRPRKDSVGLMVSRTTGRIILPSRWGVVTLPGPGFWHEEKTLQESETLSLGTVRPRKLEHGKAPQPDSAPAAHPRRMEPPILW